MELHNLFPQCGDSLHRRFHDHQDLIGGFYGILPPVYGMDALGNIYAGRQAQFHQNASQLFRPLHIVKRRQDNARICHRKNYAL
jgi:hypothetical protein